ncbi:MAG: BioY family transporter [Rhizobiales bacterium 62-17]|nr:biotin transporter BioY [Hyphomicrobiales bacterium]OJY00024.1 MAG: BioY family transporter [Rhizobiales bacterium 62-17]
MQLRDLVRVSLFAALVAALGLFPRLDLPLAGGVPITLQTLGVMLAGLFLGARLGFTAVALFLFVVLLGAPLLAGGRGGLGLLFSPSAGYLIGYPVGAFVTGWVLQRTNGTGVFLRALLACLIGGVIVIHAMGIAGLAWKTGMSLQAALLADLVFVPGDLLKAVASAYLASLMPNQTVAAPRSSS